MPAPYSADLRERVLHACAAARLSRAEIAAQFEVGESTVYLWLTQERLEGRTAPKPHAGGRATGFDVEALRAAVTEGNDRTLAELAAAYAARTRQPISPPSVRRLLRQAGITRKKKGAPRLRAGPA
jgi:transposase